MRRSASANLHPFLAGLSGVLSEGPSWLIS